MPRLTIDGGQVLSGKVHVSGAKNAVLPLLAACIMLEGETTITNVPNLMDVSIMIKMLNALGIRTEYHHTGVVRIWNHRKIRHIAPYELVTAMRASFFVAGPILARTGFAKVPLPGGCSIGARPVDIHLKGFEALGAKIHMEHGFVELQTEGLKGSHIRLDFPSVGATENLMMAAALAEGDSVIENAAQEPEIIDLGHFLNQAGAKITGMGESIIKITGVTSLNGIDTYSVIPDRVEAGTLLIAGAITKGDVTVTGIDSTHLTPVLEKFEESGLTVDCFEQSIRVIRNERPLAVDIETRPFPGFPTDMQAQMMALLTISKGDCVVYEHIFENRFMHARELIRMGANIEIDNHSAKIKGVETLSGAEVKITDLRAGAALILAGLVADGYTTVYGLKHLNRGYDNLPKKLESLGAKFIHK